LKATNLQENNNATAQPVISGGKVYPIVVCLPPLTEQKRIVEKCDRLLSTCDEIEKRQQQRQQSILRMNESAIAQLLSSQNSDEFRQHWRRICNNFDLLYSIPETIPKLRQAILQLAVQGKLVRQDPNDEPASLLLEKIKVKKEKLIQDKKLKETPLLPAITQNEIEYTIPNTWCWARLANICEFITDGTHYTPKYTEHGRIFLSSQNVKPFSFMPNNHKFVSEEAYQGYIKNRKPEFEDILLTRVGAGIGEAAVIDQKLEFAIYVSLGLLRPFKEFIDPYYLVIWLNSPIGTKHSQKNTYGKGVSQGNLNLGLIRGFVVSVPPLAEQKRIVEKCDRLMFLCDTLEAKLKQGRDSSEKLMEVAARQVLAV